jgi:hypothetical protein
MVSQALCVNIRFNFVPECSLSDEAQVNISPVFNALLNRPEGIQVSFLFG